jgi:hypothetical protein
MRVGAHFPSKSPCPKDCQPTSHLLDPGTNIMTVEILARPRAMEALSERNVANVQKCAPNPKKRGFLPKGGFLSILDPKKGGFRGVLDNGF